MCNTDILFTSRISRPRKLKNKKKKKRKSYNIEFLSTYSCIGEDSLRIATTANVFLKGHTDRFDRVQLDAPHGPAYYCCFLFFPHSAAFSSAKRYYTTPGRAMIKKYDIVLCTGAGKMGTRVELGRRVGATREWTIFRFFFPPLLRFRFKGRASVVLAFRQCDRISANSW